MHTSGITLKLPKSLIAAIDKRVASGRYRSPAAVDKQAMAALEKTERRRELEALKASLEEARQQIARGEGRVVAAEEDGLNLVRDIVRRGRRRLAREQRQMKSA